ncbi:MAG: hypothetical protein GWN59_03690, partial [Calditrichae bacterium]|nr:hypothetical protein [Calditrichia bacterium]NIV72039.1 hypothetical protein [Calditrichia bacterium]
AGFRLRVIKGDQPDEIEIPRHWLGSETDDDGLYVSSFNYDKQVTAFGIGKKLTGLHLSSYDIQKEGSARAATGRDVFLIYDPAKHAIYPGLTDLGITKDRVRSMGWHATCTEFIISDINGDGLHDIGARKETLDCGPQPGDGYKLHPLQWYLFKKGRWEYEHDKDGYVPGGNYRQLPLIGLGKSPVDFVKELCYKKNIHILNYDDFGVQAMAYELIGYQWYQWKNHGESRPQKAPDIKVIVYKDISPKVVRRLYPVDAHKRQDYRYIGYMDALNYLNRKIKELEEMQRQHTSGEDHDLYERLLTDLLETRDRINSALGQ